MARGTAAAATAALLFFSSMASASHFDTPNQRAGYAAHQQMARAPPASSSAPASGAASGAAAASGTANILPSSLAVSEPTSPLPGSVTPTAGAAPTGVVKGAPPIPQTTPQAAAFPPLDKAPPIDSPEVQQWLKEIDLSGVPNIKPTIEGGCAANQEAVATAGEDGTCWWTCGHCTRDTDVTFCPKKNTWGLSYDDGPSPYTPTLLNFLDARDIKTTFFVVGSRAVSRPDILLYEYVDGHQLSVHTWSHTALTTQSNEAIVAEFGWTKKVIKDITGVTPNSMRPPYGDIDDRVRYIAEQMGLTPLIWTTTPQMTFDTQDWQLPAGEVNLTTVMQNFNTILNGAGQMQTGFIVLEHDLFQQTVDLATEVVLPKAISQNLNLEPIITCLDMDLSESYVETASNKSNTFGNSVFPSGSAIGASATGVVPGLSSAAAAAASNNPAASGGGGGSGDSGNGAMSIGAGISVVAGAVVGALAMVWA